MARAPALARLGERETALEVLREAVQLREPFVPWIASDERYDPLRDLPDFRVLVQELRLRPAGEVQEDGGIGALRSRS